MKIKKIILLVLVSIFLIGLTLFAGYVGYKKLKARRIEQVMFEKKAVAWDSLRLSLIKEVCRYKGQAGIVIKDLNDNREISFGKDRLFPSASLVKIPIMLACFTAAQNGKFNFEDMVSIRNKYKAGGSGILKNYSDGSKASIQDLVEFMVCDSDNTAANMLIDMLGIDYLNKYFNTVGLKNTNLSRKMMDFKYRKQGVENYTTAGDMAYILESIYRKGISNSSANGQAMDLLKNQKYNDRIPAKLPDNVTVAHKTGLERKVCHDVGIIFTTKTNILICVLTRGKGSSRSAKKFISNIALEAYNYSRKL